MAGLREQTWKQKQHTHRQKRHTNWSDNSKHSLWLIRRNNLQIVVSLGELFLFVAYWTMIPIFSPRSRFFIGQIQIFHFNWAAGLDYGEVQIFSHHHHHCLSPLSGYRPQTNILHTSLSWAFLLRATHVMPTSFISLSMHLLHVSRKFPVKLRIWKKRCLFTLPFFFLMYIWWTRLHIQHCDQICWGLKKWQKCWCGIHKQAYLYSFPCQPGLNWCPWAIQGNTRRSRGRVSNNCWFGYGSSETGPAVWHHTTRQPLHHSSCTGMVFFTGIYQ